MPKPIVPLVEAGAVLALTGCFLSAAAAGGPIYHYVTDDGTYAFTDDRKKVPARYLSGVQVRPRSPLASYARFTPAETPELRPVAPAPTPTAAEAVASAFQAAPGAAAITLRTGGAQSALIDITPRPDEPPVTIEKRRFKADGTDVTRTYTVVRQGDRLLTVIKPQPHQTNVSDFEDEDDFGLDD